MLDERLGIIEGCEKICRARAGLENPELQSELLLPFVAFDSEMDNFPLGEARQYWNEKALSAKDARLREIVEAARPEILDACRSLLADWCEGRSGAGH